MDELLKEFKAQADYITYKNRRGETCHRTYGNLDWYFLKCRECGLNPKMKSDFSYTAKGDGFELVYCERDVILAIKEERKCKASF